ncbi:hypothetical protein [Cohnella candidum]|uniref:Polymer-forming cytoskeletal protein n=1 Tax=Cohnella candidum TaxID=2674991 RepID=A0A3G3JV67_9BACL|nr:hypothetical protein [Cohnella candidum]AYQ72125.1 hypothetical protein EAV92_05790 [Cohnella candidum]
MRKLCAFALLCLVCFSFLPGGAAAKGIFEHQSTFVPENQTVNDVVVIGGDVAIAGAVDSSVIVMNGDLKLESTARVGGFVLVIGGRVEQDAGAQLSDDVINISFDRATVNSLVVGGGVVIGIAAVQLAGSLLMFLLPVLFVLFGKGKTDAFVNRFRHAPRGKLVTAGLFALLFMLAVSGILILTIVGIPFILIFAVLIAVTLAFGLTVLSRILGERFQIAPGSADWMKTAAGAFVLAASVNIPFVGFFLLLGMIAYSLGLSLFWVADKLKKGKV